MSVLVIDQPEVVSRWIAAQNGSQWLSGREQAIGLAREGELVAGIMYDQWTGTSIGTHIAVLPGVCPSRTFLRACFIYPFEQLKVHKLLGFVGEGNPAARRLVEHLGLVLEATLEAAHPTGDLLIYSMTRSQCRWLSTDKKELLCRHQKPQLRLIP